MTIVEDKFSVTACNHVVSETEGYHRLYWQSLIQQPIHSTEEIHPKSLEVSEHKE